MSSCDDSDNPPSFFTHLTRVAPCVSAMAAAPVGPLTPPAVAGGGVPPQQQQVGAPACKRRRLSSKRPAPAIVPPSPSPPAVPVALLPVSSATWGTLDEATFHFLEHRGKYRAVYNKFWWWWQHSPSWVPTVPAFCTEELWALGRKDWSGLHKRQKNSIVRHFLLFSQAPPWVARYGESQWPVNPSEGKPKLVLQAQTALLTYQGDWGVFPLDPTVVGADATPDQLSEHVRQMAEVQVLWKLFLAFSDKLATDLHVPNWACCLEICLKTYEEKKELRLHAHLFLRSEVQTIRCESARRLHFLYSDPHLKDTLWGKKVAKGANWAGAYYCLAPKLGSVERYGSIQRFRDFPVDPSWVFNMVEGGKLGYEQAKEELVLCGKGLVRRLADLECWHKNRQDMRVREMVRQAQQDSRGQMLPFPRWPVVDRWLAEVTMPLQPRKKCLVLQGPSRTGKTEFVRGLFPLGAVFELNCANMKDICLDGFDCLQHRCILWDEGAAALVAHNRKVFQHPLCEVDLGHSPTGQHVRRFFLGHCCSVIATNKWHEDVKKLPSGDQEWLSANMVVFDVEQPLWMPPP